MGELLLGGGELLGEEGAFWGEGVEFALLLFSFGFLVSEGMDLGFEGGDGGVGEGRWWGGDVEFGEKGLELLVVFVVILGEVGGISS